MPREAGAADRLARLSDATRRVVASVLEGRATTSAESRRAAFAGRDHNAAVAAYVQLVRGDAHAIDDADIEALRAAGLDDDAIFELTVAAALGAGMQRLRRGLSLVGREP